MKKNYFLIAAGLALPLAILAANAKENRVASVATIILPSSEWQDPAQSCQTDYDYDSFGRLTGLTLTYPLSSDYDFSYGSKYTYTYGDSKDGLASYFTINYSPNNGVTTTTRVFNEFDSQNRLIKQLCFNMLNNTYTDVEFDYSLIPQGVESKYESGHFDPATDKKIDVQNLTFNKYCPGANKIFMEYEYRKVYNDSVVEYSMRDGRPEYVYVYYYADGKELTHKYGYYNYDGDTPKISWSGSYTKNYTDVSSGAEVSESYAVNGETGIWEPSSKSEVTTNHDTPRNNGFSRKYNWDSNTKSWKPTEEYKYTWNNNKIRKNEKTTYSGTNVTTSTTYCVYEEGKGLKTAIMLSDSQFYVIEQDYLANVSYYIYYNMQGTLLRKIKADHKYYYLDAYSELKYGEWVTPTEPFYVKDGQTYYLYSVSSKNGLPSGAGLYYMGENGLEKDKYNSILFFSNSDNLFTGYQKMETWNGVKYGDRMEVTMISENILACKTSSRSGDSYSEYDIRRGIEYRFRKDANTWVYYYYDVPYARRCDYQDGDTHVTIKTAYDRDMDLVTTTREDRIDGVGEEKGNKFTTYYTLDFDTQTWVKTGSESITKQPAPQWTNFEVPEVLDFTNPLSPSVVTTSNFNTPLSIYSANLLLQGETATKTPTNTFTQRKSIDPISGEEIVTYNKYVEYETTDRINARREITFDIEQGTWQNIDQYNLNDKHFIKDYVQKTINYEGEEYINSENHMEYNSDDLLVLNANSEVVTRWAYNNKADLITGFEYNGVDELEEDVNPVCIYVNGYDIISQLPDTDMDLWSIDGRFVASGKNRVSAPANGIYIVRVGQKAVKVILR